MYVVIVINLKICLVLKFRVNFKFWYKCVHTDLNYKITSEFLNHKLNFKVTFCPLNPTIVRWEMYTKHDGSAENIPPNFRFSFQLLYFLDMFTTSVQRNVYNKKCTVRKIQSETWEIHCVQYAHVCIHNLGLQATFMHWLKKSLDTIEFLILIVI